MFKLLNRKKELFFSLLEMFVGISKETAERFWDEQKNKAKETVDYYEDYQKELQIFIQESNKQIAQGQKRLKLVQFYNEYEKFKQEKKTICGFITVEGLHSFASYNLKELFRKKSISVLGKNSRIKLINSIEKNLEDARAGNHCPFFITLAHHFNNLIFGHAKSFTFPMNLFFRQKNGMNEGITGFGEKVLKYLLDKNQGRRILPDIKHLSVKSRIQLYDYIDQCNREFIGTQDIFKIPIICSHAAVNGRKSLKETFWTKMKNRINRKSYISRWDVNLCDEDILEIRDSNGLIGILMHEGRMPGKIFEKRLKKVLKSKELSEDERTRIQELLYIQLFLTNVYHIVNVCFNDANLNDNGKAWDLVSMGSDNDGIVNPFDTYEDSSYLTKFRNDIQDYLINYEKHLNSGYGLIDISKDYKGKHQISVLDFKKLNGNQSITDIVDKIFFQNVDDFLKKYMTKEFLVDITSS